MSQSKPMTFGDRISERFIGGSTRTIKFDAGIAIDPADIRPVLWIPRSTWESESETAIPRSSSSLRADDRSIKIDNRTDRVGDFLDAISDLAAARLRFDVDSDLLDVGDVARVPLWIVREGRPAVAAYLAAHGWTNGRIASRLDVSESTIRVNLSKFKSEHLA